MKKRQAVFIKTINMQFCKNYIMMNAVEWSEKIHSTTPEKCLLANTVFLSSFNLPRLRFVLHAFLYTDTERIKIPVQKKGKIFICVLKTSCFRPFRVLEQFRCFRQGNSTFVGSKRQICKYNYLEILPTYLNSSYFI